MSDQPDQRITILTLPCVETITADVYNVHVVEQVVSTYPVNPWSGRKVKAGIEAIETTWLVTRGTALVDGVLCTVVETLPGFWRKV